MKKILYIAPFVSPAVGGCAIYMALLQKIFKLYIQEYELNIVTERHPEAKSAVNGVLRVFPFRAGRGRKDLFSYVQYALQNFMYLWVPFILFKTDTYIVFVHSSLIVKPNILTSVLRVCRAILKIKIILDVRDPKFSANNINEFSRYDCLVSCGDNITAKLEKYGVNRSVIFEIPVMIENELITDTDKLVCLKKYGLESDGYVFNGSGILNEKGLQNSLILLQEVNLKYNKNLSYVVCGKNRDWSRNLDDASNKGLLRYIGEISHKEAMCLGVSSYLDINLSTVDSVPRHSLEIMAAGGKVLLPRGVPEFELYCPECVARLPVWDEVSSQVINIAEGRLLNQYPFEKHSVRYAAGKYAELLNCIYAN